METENSLKVGDVVRLKSGSPVMTIIGEALGDGFEVAYFDKKDELKTFELNPAALVRADDYQGEVT